MTSLNAFFLVNYLRCGRMFIFPININSKTQNFAQRAPEFCPKIFLLLIHIYIYMHTEYSFFFLFTNSFVVNLDVIDSFQHFSNGSALGVERVNANPELTIYFTFLLSNVMSTFVIKKNPNIFFKLKLLYIMRL